MYATDASRRSAISVKDLLCPSTSLENLLSPADVNPSQQSLVEPISQPASHTPQPSETPRRNTSSTPPLPSTPTSPSLSSLFSPPSSPLKKLTRGPWRLEEDRLLIDLVHRYGACHWSAIAAFLPRRSGKQARERWINQLNPALKKKNWTAKEDRVILHAHAVLGNKWSSIAQMLPGRTDNSVKNRFNSTLKRAMRERARTLDASRGMAAAMQRDAPASVSVNVDDVVESLHAKPFEYHQRAIASDTERLRRAGNIPATGEMPRISELGGGHGFTSGTQVRGERRFATHRAGHLQRLDGDTMRWDTQYSMGIEYEKYGRA